MKNPRDVNSIEKVKFCNIKEQNSNLT